MSLVSHTRSRASRTGSARSHRCPAAAPKSGGSMKTAKHQSILIVEPNVQFREELYNFLLADGYEHVTATDSLATVLEHIRHAAYDVILADAGAPRGSGLQVAKNLATLSPTTKIILMI